MNNQKLSLYGFDDRFKALAAQYQDMTPCRVISQEKGFYRVVCESGIKTAIISGKMRYEVTTVSELPAVGDFVMLAKNSTAENSVINTVLPRKSIFIRRAAGTSKTEQVVAANVDTVFLCMSLNNDFNLRRLERYLSVAWESGAAPVIVLTKSDLCADINSKINEVESIAVGTDILYVSVLTNDGVKQLMPYIKPNETIAFIGSSGVGKSTLINHLLGEERLAANGLRNDDKGRHTTTHRELLRLPDGAMLIDTPGMRELGLWDAGDGIQIAFSDIETLALKCRFNDCSHGNEPGCAVRAALDSGELSYERWMSYRKLSAENAYFSDSGSYLEAKEKKFKKIAKLNKSNKKK